MPKCYLLFQIILNNRGYLFEEFLYIRQSNIDNLSNIFGAPPFAKAASDRSFSSRSFQFSTTKFTAQELKFSMKDRSSHQRCSVKKDIVRKFCKIYRKTPVPETLFDKVSGLRPVTLLKRSL